MTTFEENNDVPRGGVTTIADIAFATLNSGKKTQFFHQTPRSFRAFPKCKSSIIL